MEHIYMRIPVGKWSIDLKNKSNLCICTCLLEPNVATPLKNVSQSILSYFQVA